MSVEICNLSKKYKRHQALSSVSFTVNDHEIAAFLGPNGAGKSTTLKIIGGFLTPDSGRVRINGADFLKNSNEIKKTIGYLPENNPLYPEMYVTEYLEYAAGMYRLGKNTKSAVERVIEETGLYLEHTKKIGQLSKGYKQRVGLAQAIIHDPSVLLLDEPTTGLDPNQSIEIRNLIKTLGENRSILFSTHNLHEAAFLCKHILVIDKGRIVADDDFETLTKNESLESVFTALTVK